MLLVILFAIVFSTSVFAQTPTPDLFDQYQTDYLFQRDQYQAQYLLYTEKKNVHTKYHSPATQTELLTATKNVLIARNTMFKTYFVALRALLNRYQSANPTDTNKNQIELSKWETWFDEQNTIISSYNNLADIKKWTTDTFKPKYILLQKTIYTALVQHEINLENQVFTDIQSLAAEIQPLLPSESSDQSWFAALPVKSDIINGHFKTALDLTAKNQTAQKFSNFYPDAKNELIRARGYLSDLLRDLRTIAVKNLSTP